MKIEVWVRAKVECLESIQNEGEKFLSMKQPWGFEDLDRFVLLRTQLIRKLQWIDKEIAAFLASPSSTFGSLSYEQREDLRSSAQRQSDLAASVLRIEGRVIEAVELRKEELIKERWIEERAREVLGKFKSGSQGKAGEELDRVL